MYYNIDNPLSVYIMVSLYLCVPCSVSDGASPDGCPGNHVTHAGHGQAGQHQMGLFLR